MSNKKVAFTYLGCDKNRVDSEVMVGILRKDGFEIIPDEAEADVIIVNTCCFIKDALEESIEKIIELAENKTTGNCKGLVVAGCLSERYQQDFFDELPEVDAIVSTGAYESIGEVVENILGEDAVAEHKKYLADINSKMNEENANLRILSTAPYYAYLKISEGCDNNCTYCIIPKLRGKHRSRTMDSLVNEARELAKNGVKELILVAQDTSIYGRDLYGSSKLHELLEKLSEIDGICWLRVLYCYPETLTQETIDVMATNPKVCHYLDMPIQHASDTVLKRMGRKTTQDEIRKKVEDLRKAMPDIAIRTTAITGFPAETEEEFQELIDFVKEIKFEILGVFSYSNQEGTPAFKMGNQIDDEIKEVRRERIMEEQKNIAMVNCQKEVGKIMKVLVDGKIPDENVYCGRSTKDAPDIDGLVFINSEEELMSGEFIEVEIIEATDYDLVGVVVDK